MAEAYIIDAVRTPRGIGKQGKGALAGCHPQHLAATVLKAIKERNHLDTSTVDDVIWSVSTQDGLQAGDMGRMAALDAGYDITSSGTTLDRFCGGGITSVALAAAQVMSGMEDCLVAGGTEMMSLTAAMAQEKMRAGIKPPMMGSYNERLRKVHPQSHQGVCGDAIASMEGFTREELDEVGYRSQQRAAEAIAEGRFAKSVVPVVDDEGNVILDHEEYPRPQTTMEDLAKLEPAFPKIADVPLDEHGTTFRKLINQKYPDLEIKHFHHAGNSSGVVDGAAAVLVTSKAYAQKHGLKPRARIVATANMGDCPTLMLNAPVPAA
ncbi:MAG: acetyl-CoA C-acetyltransferase, partial [Erythrobacter cryptus]